VPKGKVSCTGMIQSQVYAECCRGALMMGTRAHLLGRVVACALAASWCCCSLLVSLFGHAENFLFPHFGLPSPPQHAAFLEYTGNIPSSNIPE
jgi:hypothetical protein